MMNEHEIPRLDQAKLEANDVGRDIVKIIFGQVPHIGPFVSAFVDRIGKNSQSHVFEFCNDVEQWLERLDKRTRALAMDNVEVQQLYLEGYEQAQRSPTKERAIRIAQIVVDSADIAETNRIERLRLLRLFAQIDDLAIASLVKLRDDVKRVENDPDFYPKQAIEGRERALLETLISLGVAYKKVRRVLTIDTDGKSTVSANVNPITGDFLHTVVPTELGHSLLDMLKL
jgi:hypothetical protein